MDRHPRRGAVRLAFAAATAPRLTAITVLRTMAPGDVGT
jgi:hypothetical protein